MNRPPWQPVTPDEHADPCIPHHRRPRVPDLKQTRKRHAITPMGGLRHGCGCVWTYMSGGWVHVVPCRRHPLRPFTVTDEHMQDLA